MPIVNLEKCRLCKTCIRVCPLNLLKIDSNNNVPVIENEANCVQCGHCEAVCPTRAITVPFPVDNEEPKEIGNVDIDPETIMYYFKNRRSIRNYQKEVVPKKKIEQLLDIARYAPSGHNRQLLYWTVIYDPLHVQQLAKGVIDKLEQMVEMNHPMAIRFNAPILLEAWNQGNDVICRNAPHIVVIHAPKTEPSAKLDGIIALSHLELAAPAFGLGACWAGFAMVISNLDNPSSPNLREILGVPEDHDVIGILMLGIPDNQFERIPRRKPLRLSWN